MLPEVENEQPKPFRGLRWKITLVFSLIAVLTWFVGVMVGGLYEYFALVDALQPAVVARRIEPATEAFARHLQTNPPNLAAVDLQLDRLAEDLKTQQRELGQVFYYRLERYDYSNNEFAFFAVTDREGKILQTESATITRGENARENNARPLTPEEQQLVAAALDENANPENLRRRLPDAANLLAFPLVNEANGQTIGALLVRARVPFSTGEAARKVFLDFALDLREMLLIIILFGLIVGFKQAMVITRRFNQIGDAARAWSRGDFSARAHDGSGDELGILARRLNRMANELRAVFALKQELAAVEERNRIARDLHDSVKQQIFGLAMQLSAARNLLRKEQTAAVAMRLEEAEKLAQNVQHELVNLIKELRPPDELSGKTLDEKLRLYAADWSRQHSIEAQIKAENVPPLPRRTENTLFRIAQESLSNIARHSRANSVSIEIFCDGDGKEIELSLADDGRGFEPGKALGGSGLRNIRERAEALPAGSIRVESQPGRGARVTVRCQIENVKTENGNGKNVENGKVKNV